MLKQRNPANTFTGTWTNPAITADSTLDWIAPGRYVIYKAGSNTKALNLSTRAVEQTNTDSYTVIQAVLDLFAASSGPWIFINTGLYTLSNTLIPVQNSSTHIVGESQNGFARLRPTGDFPAIRVFGSYGTLENLFLDHNQVGYTSGLLEITGGTDNTFKGLKFADNVTKAGYAIRMDNTIASIYRNHFETITTEGFDSVIHAVVQNFATGSRFINKNDFTALNCNVPKRVLKVTSETGGAFDDNNWFNCYLQAYSGTTAGWDYETGHLGHSWYTNHFGCFIDDLPVGINYALLGAGTQIYLDGCHPAWKIGGSASAMLETNGLYIQRQGTTTFSGNGSTKTFTVTHNMNASVTPRRFYIQPNSVDAVGSPWVDPTTATTTTFVITYPVAPPTGTNNVILSWRCAY